MEKILMLRGSNSHFYFVEISSQGNDQLVMEVKARVIGNAWECETNQIYKVNEGSIIAMEIDPENTFETDSIFTYDRVQISERPQALNKLYIVDDHEDLHLIA